MASKEQPVNINVDDLAPYMGEAIFTYLRYRWQWLGLHVAWVAFTLLCAFSLAALLSA